jgi:hypothetical protein
MKRKPLLVALTCVVLSSTAPAQGGGSGAGGGAGGGAAASSGNGASSGAVGTSSAGTAAGRGANPAAATNPSSAPFHNPIGQGTAPAASTANHAPTATSVQPPQSPGRTAIQSSITGTATAGQSAATQGTNTVGTSSAGTAARPGANPAAATNPSSAPFQDPIGQGIAPAASIANQNGGQTSTQPPQSPARTAPQSSTAGAVAAQQRAATQGTNTAASNSAGVVGAPGVGVGHSANGRPIGTTGSGPGSPEQPINSGSR